MKSSLLRRLFLLTPVLLAGCMPEGDASLVEAWIEDGQLVAVLAHGGGCREEPLSLEWLGDLDADARPPETTILVRHANVDTCESYVESTRRLDLRPLREAFARRFPNRDGDLLLLIDAPGDRRITELPYRFNPPRP